MTPEEVFAQLRDIHSPPSAVRETLSYDIRPVAVFFIMVFAVLALRLLWRRAEAGRLLSRIDPRGPHADQRGALIRLADARRRGRSDEPVPDAAFQPPGDLTGDGVTRLRRWVSRRIL